MKRFIALLTFASLLAPAAARADTSLLADMNAQAKATVQTVDAVRSKRRRTNLVTALIVFAEGALDCEQTKYVLHVLGGRENNRATPRYITSTLRRNKPLACIGAWGLAAGAGYAAGRDFDPLLGRAFAAGEAVNILSNFGSGARL